MGFFRRRHVHSDAVFSVFIKRERSALGHIYHSFPSLRAAEEDEERRETRKSGSCFEWDRARETDALRTHFITCSSILIYFSLDYTAAPRSSQRACEVNYRAEKFGPRLGPADKRQKAEV